MDFASRRVMLDESLVLHFAAAFRRQLSIRWNPEEPARFAVSRRDSAIERHQTPSHMQRPAVPGAFVRCDSLPKSIRTTASQGS